MDSVSSAVNAMKEEQKRLEDKNRGRMCYVPKPGYVWNPFSKYPNNLPCYCGSGKKFKKCHQATIPLTIQQSQEKEVKDYLNRMIKYVTMLKDKGIIYKVEEKKDTEVVATTQVLEQTEEVKQDEQV